MIDLDAIEARAPKLRRRIAAVIETFRARPAEPWDAGLFATMLQCALDDIPEPDAIPCPSAEEAAAREDVRALAAELRRLRAREAPGTFADGYAAAKEEAARTVEDALTTGLLTPGNVRTVVRQIRALAPAAVPGGDVAGLVEEALRLCANRDEAKELFRQQRDVRGYEAALEYPRARLAEIAELLARALQAPAGKDRP